MAVYKIFPTQDTTLYSLFPQMNTGLDEIVEATTTTFGPYGNEVPHASRFLMQFSSDEITDILENKIGTNPWSTQLRCYLSTVTGLTETSTVLVNPVAQTWVNGTGKYLDQPISTDGASWVYTDSENTSWKTSILTLPPNATASYTSSVYPGGGIWYTGSSNLGYPNVEVSQSFSLYDDKDLNFNVTSTVHNWYSESINSGDGLPNYGFIVRQSPSQEFITGSDIELKYFSIDTNTIYPPQLEFRWDDFSYSTSSAITEITTPSVYVSLDDNPGTFYSESINRFRINCRPKNPSRVWTTSSLYTKQYYLPTASYYAIKDLDTNEFVVNFDTTYTKISADTTSSYFDIYMNGLEPERYYKILIETTISNSTLVLDDNYYFKVAKG